MSAELVRVRDVQGELPAAARLAGTASTALVDRVQELHEAVAGRSFSGPAAAGSPARAMHDGVARAVYGGVRSGLRAAAEVVGVLAEHHPVARSARPLATSGRGSFALAVVNGWLGDRLDAEGSPLAVPLAVRSRGRDVACSPEALRDAFPQATPRVAVFLHGLMETDDGWRLGADRAPTYADTLVEHGWTPVFLRANTGLHISENGRRLAALLEDLVEGWPVHVDRLALIGHSMGGLIARSACHQAAADGRSWQRRVRHLVLLGTPHHGAPLERLTARGVALLSRLPEGEPIAAILRSRSAGIKDLRHGALLEDDWRELDPDLDLDDCRCEVPLPDGVRHHVVAATLHADPAHPLSRVLGDLLVLDSSAHGRHETRHIPFEPDDVRHLGGLTHFALLNHPAVHELLVEWLCERRALPA